MDRFASFWLDFDLHITSLPSLPPATLAGELGDYFNIEERWVVRLNEAMKKRQDTKAQDLEKLYEVLEKARSPTGLLTVQRPG